MLERYKESYKSITAGEELKGRILSQAKENFQNKSRERSAALRRSTMATAAGLALIIGLGITFGAAGFQKTQVFYKGDKVRRREAAVSEVHARAYSFNVASETESGVPLEIKTEIDAKISVSDGEIVAFDGNSEELLFIGSEFTTDKTVLLFWNLSEATEKEPVLTIRNDYEQLEYTLTESENGGYVIKLTAEEKK